MGKTSMRWWTTCAAFTRWVDLLWPCFTVSRFWKLFRAEVSTSSSQELESESGTCTWQTWLTATSQVKPRTCENEHTHNTAHHANGDKKCWFDGVSHTVQCIPVDSYLTTLLLLVLFSLCKDMHAHTILFRYISTTSSGSTSGLPKNQLMRRISKCERTGWTHCNFHAYVTRSVLPTRRCTLCMLSCRVHDREAVLVSSVPL